MISSDMVSSALGVKVIKSSQMENAVKDWNELYRNSAVWNDNRIISLCLASAISREFSRLVLSESDIYADSDNYINEQFRILKSELPVITEKACALGGIIVKPYISNGKIYLDTITPDCFFPVDFSENMITSAVFPEQLVIGKNCYTRLEFHRLNSKNNQYTVENKCYRSSSKNSLGSACSFSEVPQWADMKDYTVLENAEKPLFAYFKMPFANIVDPENPLGISVYENAVDLIRQADTHWERILWEFESSERAIDATEDIFRYNPLTCQYSFNRQKAAFSIFTDSASDYITAVLSELPSEKGQKVSGELSWTTERDIKTQKISVLKVVKTAEDGTVWLWNSTEKIGLCVRIAD